MKTVLLTGATGGLGQAVAGRLSREYRAVALYRSESSWQRLRKTVPAVEGIASFEQVAACGPFHIAFLLSDSGSGVTGQLITMSASS
jgi:nucleoside-diphosphate-sugar epimerase